MTEMTEIEKAAFKAPTDAHWYLPTGAPFHKVPYKEKKKAGQLRDATLKDARAVGAARSVTSIQKFIAKPQLEVWSRNQLIEAIRRSAGGGDWRLILESGDLEKWLAEIIKDAGRVRDEAAERGDKLHDALMRFSRGKTIPRAFSKHIEAVQKALSRRGIDILEGRAETSFYSSEGYGGTIDWHRPLTQLHPLYPVILDYKTREKLDPKVRVAWPEKAMQLAAYRRAIMLPDADCYNVFVDETAHVCVHHWDEPTLRREEKKFLLLLKYIHVSDNYRPIEKERAVRLWEKEL